MKQIAFLIVALASAMPARTPAFQQAPPDDGKREFIVSGCLLRNGYAGYAVDDSRVVAIDGQRLPDPAPASAAAPDEPPDRLPHLDVKAVKTLAPRCT